MRFSRLSLCALAWLAGACGVAYFVLEARALVVARSQLEFARLERQSWRSSKNRVPVGSLRRAGELDPPRQNPPASSVANATRVAAHPDRERESESPLGLLADNPALQNLFLAAENVDVDLLYLPLYRQLGLGRPQMDEFRSLLFRRNEQSLDIALAQRAHDLPGDDPALSTLRARAATEFSRRMQSLLGGGYQTFLEYERAVPVRRVVNELAGAFALSGEPLTSEQADNLTKVLAEASAPYAAGAAADPDQVDWQRALGESEKVLSQPQQRIFTNAVPSYRPPEVPAEDNES